MTNNTSVLDKILSASSLTDLTEFANEPAQIYKKLARKCHPDMFQSTTDKERAEKAFVHLAGLKNKTNSTSPTGVIKTKKHEYHLGNVVSTNEVFTNYKATYDAGHESASLAFLKSPKDTDLAESYSSSLKKLKEVPEKYRAFYPSLLENFRYKNPSTHKDHSVIATKDIEGFQPLSNVLSVYPNGIGGRDVAWIFRRMLVAVGNAHDIGLVHGAPTLDAFLINAELHGIILSEWQYSTEVGSSLKAVPQNYKNIYPDYALQKESVSGRLDTYILAETASALLANNEPRQLFAFFKGCKLSNTPNASVLLADFDKLLLRIYGKPKFSKFTLEKE